MRVLITGGAGFVGSFLADALIEGGHRVRLFDNLDPQVHQGKVPAHLNRQAEFVVGDVRDRDALGKALEGIDTVVHFAASVGVGQSMYQVAGYTATNDLGAANVLDLVVNERRDQIRKMIIAGSMSEYGEGAYQCAACGLVKPAMRSAESLASAEWDPPCPKCGAALVPKPTPEDWPLACASVYAINKRTQEDLFLTVGAAFGVPAVSLRFFNIYGPRQSLSNPYTGVIANFISRIKAGNRPTIFEDGQQSRDFVSVYDIVAAVMAAMVNDRANQRVFNVGTGQATTIVGIATTLARLMGTGIEPEVTGRPRKGDIRHCYADITRATEELGWKPKASMDEALAELIEWSRSVESEDRSAAAQMELRAKGVI